MPLLCMNLFGRFSVRSDEHMIEGLEARRVQHVLCYLILHRHQQRSRESLASLFWGDSSTQQSKKYLRQTLWQIQSALARAAGPANPLLLVDPEWVQVNPQASLWVDVVVFEEAWSRVRDIPNQHLDAEHYAILRDAIELYRGDLLEGAYEDWCLFERERLQNLYLAMIDKLLVYCEAHREYATGLHYGANSLKYDPARERTHRSLMRLYYLSGDRSAALRQYQQCVAALEEELCVQPDRRTQDIYEQIRSDRLDDCSPSLTSDAQPAAAPPIHLQTVLQRLRQLQGAQATIQREIQETIHSLERAMYDRGEQQHDTLIMDIRRKVPTGA